MKKQLLLTLSLLLASFATFALTPLTGGPSTICIGSFSHAIEDSLYPGGTWSSSNTAVATVDSTYRSWHGKIAGIAAGTVTITYTLGSSYVTTTVTVQPYLPAITGTTSICAGATSSLANPITGGTWSCSPSYIATVGSSTGIVTGTGKGTATVQYYLTGYCSVSITMSVTNRHSDSIKGPSLVCVGATTALSSMGTGGGTWSSSDLSVATVIPATGVVSGIAVGTAVISYMSVNICGLDTSTMVISVSNTTPSSPITGPTTAMMTIGTGVYNSVPGGTWSSSNPAVATIHPSAGYVTPVSVGTTILTYTVVGCGGTSFTTAPMTVTPYDEISGTVTFAGPTTFSGAVKIYLIRYDPVSMMLQASDSISTICWGWGSVNYKFHTSVTDSFRVKAAHDTGAVGIAGYVPTYHNSSFYWYSATVFQHTYGTTDINKDITMNYGTLTTGTGFIGGSVLAGANKGTAGDPPAVGMRMYALNSSGTIVQQAKTDAAGNYTFTNLPFGTYTVFPEVLGYLTTAYTSINLTAASPSMTAASFVQHTISHTITPIPAAVENIASGNSSVFIFPNPSNGKLNLQWHAVITEKGNISVSDVTGRKVYNATIDMVQGKGIKQLDLSLLTDGLYTVTVKSESVNYSNKIQIAK